MSSDSLVLDWLNNEIKLKPKVENIIEEFADGYRFGEVLYKLKEITLDEYKSLKKDPVTLEEKKSNCSKIKHFLSQIYNLEIREEEFDSVIEKDISKATVILYKLKNSTFKKKIHFADIKLFVGLPNPEEIQKKVKEIMDNEYYQELKDEENNNQYNSTNKNNMNMNKFISSHDNSQFSTPKRGSSIIELKDKNIKKVNEEINDNESDHSNNDSHDRYKNEELLMNYNDMNQSNEFNNNNILDHEPKKKKFLPPLTPIVSRTNVRSGLSKELLSKFKKIQTENNKNLYDVNNSTNEFVQKETKERFNAKNRLIISEEKPNRYKEYFSTEPSYDENKDEMLQKLRDNLKRKIELKKLKDKQKQEQIKKEFDFRIYDVPEIDFFKQDKNPFYKRKPPRMNLSSANNNRYLINSSSRRLQYSKDLKESKERQKTERRNEYYRSLFQRNSEFISQNMKKFKLSTNLDTNEQENEQFNKAKYFNSLKNLNYAEYDQYITKKHQQMKDDLPSIKEIVFLIIDYTVDAYFYQKENNVELLDLPLFINLSTLFMNNKPAREKVMDEDADLIKEVKKSDELDINSLELTVDEKYLIEDYLNYCGIFSSKLMFNDEIIGGKFDLHIVNEQLPSDYEPTQNDIDDMFLPSYNMDNYPLGENVLDILEHKYGNANKNNKESKEPNNNNNDNTNSNCKWSHIPYKLSLVGYPLSGRKTIAENLVKKYPNLKIYSCQKLLREYYNTYKTLTEEIDVNHTKYKSMKPNQLEQLKQERQKELDNFEPILQLIKPYIDQIKEATSENPEGGEPNQDANQQQNPKFIPPNDEVLFEVLKNKIETDFQDRPEEEKKNEIIEYQTKISNINKQIEDIKKIISESNKPNPKDEQSLSNLQKEIQNLKQNYIKGIILVDFPSNLNQCNIIENYLTGYISELEKPKTEKNVIIQSLEGLIDFKFQPKENVTIKKSGIDFIINLPVLENNVLNRFSEIKYDPVGDKIYTKTEINEAKNNIDKKIIDRLVNEVPYLTKDIFDYYKQEYDDNISKINLFYNKFGITIHKNMDLNNLIDLDDDKEIRRAYQSPDITGVDNEKNEINKIIDFISEQVIDCIYNENDKSEKIIFYSQHPELNVNEENDRIKFDPEVENQEQAKEEKEKENDAISRSTRKKTKRGTRRGGSLGEIKFMNIITNNSSLVISKLIDFEIYYKKNVGGFIHLIEVQRNDIYTRLNLIQKKFRDFLNYKTQKKKVLGVFIEKYNSFFNVNPKFFYNQKAINEFTSDIDVLNNNLWSLINIKQKESVKELDSIKNSGFIENELVGFYKNIQNLFLIETEKFLEMINSIINLYKIKKDPEENEPESFTKEIVLQGSIPVQFEIKNKAKKEDNNNDLVVSNENQKMNESHISEVSNEEEDMNTTKYMNKIISDISTNVDLFYVNGIKLVYNLQNKTENLIKLIKEALMQTFKKPKRKRLNSNANESFNSSQMISMIGTTKGIDPFAHEEKIRRMFQNEKNKYKYRIYYLKEFCKKYTKMIFKTTTNIYNNVDGWIVQSVSLQNNALNTVIGKIRELLNDKKLIDEKVDIEPIEMDAFEIDNNTNIINNNGENNPENENENENNEEEVLVKPIDDKSIVANTVYYKLNIDYLLKDDFINYKIEDIKKCENLNENKDDEIINDVKEEEINEDNKSENINNIANNVNMKEAKENEFKYYYDINNFYYIYTMIKRYEIEENTISQDILNQMFFRQYVLNVYNDLNEGNKTNEDNNKENKDKSEEEEDEEKSNHKHKDLKKKKYLSPICDGLKGINTKKIFKLFNLYHIPVEIHEQQHKKESENENEDEKAEIKEDAKNGPLEKVNENEEEHKPDEENKNEGDNKDKDKEENKIEDNKEKEENKKEEGNENSKHEEENNTENDEKDEAKENNENKEKKEEEKKVEYETYIKLKDLFTILSLIGCQILTVDEDDKINKELKDKIVKNGFLTKEDFMEYNFWFEKYFEYQNNLDSLNDEEYDWIIDEHKDKRMTIKDFLFELWKDDTGNSINIKQILSILKIGNYITDISNNDNKKYYDVILGQ